MAVRFALALEVSTDELLGMAGMKDEHEAGDIPAGRVPQTAKALDVSVEEILGVSQTTARERGPKSQLEKQLEAIADLPRAQQQ